MSTPEPVFTWDKDHEAFHTREAHEWVKRYLDRATTIYRVEFYEDGPHMIVYQYKVNAEGKRYREGEDAAREAPFRVELDELPLENPAKP